MLKKVSAPIFSVVVFLSLASAGCKQIRYEGKRPIANAGAAVIGSTGTPVSLDGTGSEAQSDGSLQYRWSFQELPVGATANFNDASVAQPSFTPTGAGTYVASLIVSENGLDSLPATVTITVSSGAPTALITKPLGPANVGTAVALDGTGSTDPDGHLLRFQWAMTSLPAGSAAKILDPAAARTSFVPDVQGDYTLQLIVDDGPHGNFAVADTATIKIGDARPVALIVPLGAANVGTAVTLNGTESHQPDGHRLNYQWAFARQPAGSKAQIADPSAAVTSFVPDRAGAYDIQLVVDDGKYGNVSDPATATLTIGQAAPTAQITTPLGPANAGTPVVLDASTSTQVDNHPLNFRWSFTVLPAGSSTQISAPGATITSFVPDRNGLYTVQLVADDGSFGNVSVPVTASITVGDGKPTAAITKPLGPANSGVPVVLDAAGSVDPDGHLLNYHWSFTAMPAGSLAKIADPTAAHTSFIPDKQGAYAVKLVADDGHFNNVSTPDFAQIVVGSGQPIATIATPLAAANTGTPVVLDGTGSTDPDGHPLHYTWAFTSLPAGSNAQLAAPSAAKTSFTPDKDGTYAIKLVVDDGAFGNQSAATVATITVGSGVPTANITALGAANNGTPVVLDGSSSIDPDGHRLNYQWSFASLPAGSSTTIANPTAVTTSFTPDRDGVYVLQLVVNDGAFGHVSDRATESITVGSGKPTAFIAALNAANTATPVALDASGSTDPDGHGLNFQWSFTTLPAGSTAQIANATAVQTSFTPDKPGVYAVKLVVNDGSFGNVSAPANESLSVGDGKPTATITKPLAQVNVGTPIPLEGLASTDPDGHLLQYSWTLISAPPGSAATIAQPGAVTTSFTPDKAGAYAVQLVTHDGAFGNVSVPDSVSVTVGDGKPLATIAALTPVTPGTPVTLDGTSSLDPDNHPLNFQWKFTTVPSGSQAKIAQATSAKTSFTPDKQGSYMVQLVVDDGAIGNVSVPASESVTIGDGTPVANITKPLPNTAKTGTPVVLDGINSSDPDKHLLYFTWTFTSKPAGSKATISEPKAMTTSFTPDVTGLYAVRLVVDDGAIGNVSLPDNASLNVGSGKPTARIAALPNPNTGTPVVLDGTTSFDPDNHLINYTWSFKRMPAGSKAQILNPTAAMTSFTPDVAGLYEVKLVVDDGAIGNVSDPATETSNVNSGKPTAAITKPLTTPKNTGTPVVLDGSNSKDPDLHPLHYSWTFKVLPSGSYATIAAPSAKTTSFTPDMPGEYAVELVVNDGSFGNISDADSAGVTVGSGKPIVSAGLAQNADANDDIPTVNPTATDPDGHPLNYLWSLVSVAPGSSPAINSPTSLNPSLLNADGVGQYVLKLVADDGSFGNVSDPGRTIFNVKAAADWTKATNPVLAPAVCPAFDGRAVESPTVVRNPTNNEFIMLYGGHDCATHDIAAAHWSIGRVTSPDEVSFTGRAQVHTGGLGVTHPTALYHDGKLKMWYAQRASRDCDPDTAVVLRFFWEIYYAESSNDGVTWTGATKVLSRGVDPAWDSGDVLAPLVSFRNGVFEMWYAGDKFKSGCSAAEDGLSDYQIGYASSVDGLTWVKYSNNPVVEKDGALHVGNPSGLYEFGAYKLWPGPYFRNGADDTTNYRLGYARSLDPLAWPGLLLMPQSIQVGASADFDSKFVSSAALRKENSVTPLSTIPIYKAWYAGDNNPKEICQNSNQSHGVDTTNKGSSIGYARRGELE